jgi:hypothetical protein
MHPLANRLLLARLSINCLSWLVPLRGGPDAKGSMCLGGVAVVDCVLGLGCSRSEFDFFLLHVGGRFHMGCSIGVEFVEK